MPTHIEVNALSNKIREDSEPVMPAIDIHVIFSYKISTPP